MFKYREKEGLRGVVVLDLFLLGFGVAGIVSMFKNLSLVPLDQSSLEAGSGSSYVVVFLREGNCAGKPTCIDRTTN